MPEKHALSLALAAALLPCAALAQSLDERLPTGGSVAAGTAAISQLDARQLRIDQSTSRAIINWQSFSIGADARVTFVQPGASSVALNRVLGNNPSEILGRLDANGQVFLSNPSGVLFARGASVNVGGLFATTLSIDDADFLAGRNAFHNSGNAAAVVNRGSIQTPSGYAALAGPQVRNEGIIVAHQGSVALAAGDRVSLDMVGDGLIQVSVDQAAVHALAANSGTLQADGGRVVMTARAANALLDTVVENSGVVRARSLVERAGEIVLDAGAFGTVVSTGTLDSDGTIAINPGPVVAPPPKGANGSGSGFQRLDAGTIAASLPPVPSGVTLINASGIAAPQVELSIEGAGISLPAGVTLGEK